MTPGALPDLAGRLLHKGDLSARFTSLLLVPALAALLAGSPYRGEGDIPAYVRSRFTPDASAGLVTPELAGHWIMEGRPLEILDLRPVSDWREYRLPGAASLPAGPEGLTEEGSRRIAAAAVEKVVVLYGEEQTPASRIRAAIPGAVRDSVFVMEGGLDAWTRRILYPSLGKSPSPWAAAMFERIRPISRALGGLPRVGVPDEEATIRDLPPLLRRRNEAEGDTGPARSFRRGC